VSIKVALCGPPHSGKSCLREGLKGAVNRITDAEPYCYVITACPDGEGAWFQKSLRQNPELAKELKRRYNEKFGFSPEYVLLAAKRVRRCTRPLTLVDIGGKADEKNEVICAGATHAVILTGDTQRIPEWRDFTARVGLSVVAEIQSDYTGVADVVRWDTPDFLKGSIHRLERGEPVADRPMIQALAELLLRLARASETAELEIGTAGISRL